MSHAYQDSREAGMPAGSQVPHGAAPVRPPLLDSLQLFQGHRAVEIHHNGELYRLQATRTGKLILTK